MGDPRKIAIKHRVIFEGLDADRGTLEAYPAAQSLEGLIWALSVATNYGVSGKIRQRGDLSSNVRIFISPPRRGSFINELNILVLENPFITVVVGGWAVNTVTPFINGLIKMTFDQALGAAKSAPSAAKRALGKLKDDDIHNLVSRIEPPLTRAHQVIGRTAETIQISTPRKPLLLLNSETKAFMEARLREGFHILETNITSFNVLTGNGRLFDTTECATVPFSLKGGTTGATREAIADSMRQYSMGREGTIKITAERIETVEGRIKQWQISAAEEIPQSDWINGVDPMRARRI